MPFYCNFCAFASDSKKERTTTEKILKFYSTLIFLQITNNWLRDGTICVDAEGADDAVPPYQTPYLSKQWSSIDVHAHKRIHLEY